MEESNQDKSCKTPRWRLLKGQLSNLSQAAFKEKMTESEIIILDVRTAQEYQMAHIPEAIHINYFAEDFWDAVEKLDNTKDILVYCRTGRRSIRACTLMKNGGFDTNKVFNLEGGFTEWLTNYPDTVSKS